MNRKLRFGMIGGGRGAFIGAVHRIAAIMDGKARLVAGAFSSDPKRSKASAADLFVKPDRAYGSYAEMAKAEAKMPADQRLDFVVIVTPNHQHFPPAKLFLEAGFNVVLDKPATFNLAEAKQLRAIVKKT
uniref:Gfo/Idh/MocA family protein n=1 Tax=Cephaloticoccus sp. TaxID=1985742 RepID=UPI00404A04A6